MITHDEPTKSILHGWRLWKQFKNNVVHSILKYAKSTMSAWCFIWIEVEFQQIFKIFKVVFPGNFFLAPEVVFGMDRGLKYLPKRLVFFCADPNWIFMKNGKYLLSLAMARVIQTTTSYFHCLGFFFFLASTVAVLSSSMAIARKTDTTWSIQRYYQKFPLFLILGFVLSLMSNDQISTLIIATFKYWVF